jgi:Acyl-protein synthetase, LuxE.
MFSTMNTPLADIFDIRNTEDFARQAMETFRFQATHCQIYADYLRLLQTDTDQIQTPEQIPHLPIELFKTHFVYCGPQPPEITFTSSATTGMVPAQHPVASLALYEESFTKTFRQYIGAPSDYSLLALLPSYLERQGSSLVYMVDKLMQQAQKPHSGYYLYNHEELHRKLMLLREEGLPVLLIGVSFALLDFAEAFPLDFPDLKIIETGGMKGRGQELSRSQLHRRLTQGFGTTQIYSEYGMAELLSQAYALEDERFRTPPWMRVSIRDVHNPFRSLPPGRRGGINIIDLANRYSCAFLETQDLGLTHPDHSFEVLGRIPYSELRGCNMLVG